MIDINELRSALMTGHDVQMERGVIVPDNCAIISTEFLEPNPRHMRGTFSTTDVLSFISYIEEACKTELPLRPAIFIKKDRAMEAWCVFDFGAHDDPEWGLHQAYYAAEYAPLYGAIRSLIGRSGVSQQEVMEFIEDYGAHVRFFTLGEDGKQSAVPQSAAYAAFRDLTAQAVRELKSKRGDLAVERTSMERVQISTAIPTHFSFCGACYAGLPVETRTFRVSAFESGSSVSLQFREVGEVAADDASMMSLESLVRSKAPEGARVYVGTWNVHQRTMTQAFKAKS